MKILATKQCRKLEIHYCHKTTEEETLIFLSHQHHWNMEIPFNDFLALSVAICNHYNHNNEPPTPNLYSTTIMGMTLTITCEKNRTTHLVRIGYHHQEETITLPITTFLAICDWALDTWQRDQENIILEEQETRLRTMKKLLSLPLPKD